MKHHQLILTGLIICGSVFNIDTSIDTSVQAQVTTLGASMNQVTSVSRLQDVSPTDWAYEALQSLVEKYGCVVGYPDQTFRGDRPLTRYEFAAGLNACLNSTESRLQGNSGLLQ